MKVLFAITFLFYILHFYAVPMYAVLLLNSYKMLQTVKLLKQWITQGGQFDYMTIKFATSDIACFEVIWTSIPFNTAQLFHVIHYTTVWLLLRTI